MEITEIFKPISGYEGFYEISNMGNVKSFKKHNGSYFRFLKPIKNYFGYLSVNLSKDSIVKIHKIHILVITYFYGDRPEGMHINHKDGIKINNYIENLEFCTPKENTQHAYRIGLNKAKKGKESHMYGKIGVLSAKSTKMGQYSINGELIKTWNSISDIVRKFGYSQGNISRNAIGLRKTAYGSVWKYL